MKTFFLTEVFLTMNMQQLHFMWYSAGFYIGFFARGGGNRVRQWVGLHKIAPGGDWVWRMCPIPCKMQKP